ncbi:MAG: type II toxin-antitoxin system RelE/ParE family toxin [Acidobacteria bacterium]|nr:type II toxin-antitoxin system RelE/ParE family toxin [Acidobacteriota bacterium]
MPRTEVAFYRDARGEAPVLDWLTGLRRSDRKAYEGCVAAIERLAQFGYELRRPTADFLRDGIYELRIRRGRVNHRILYFFGARNLAILGHALTKEAKIPEADLERALRRKKAFEADPVAHSYYEEA